MNENRTQSVVFNGFRGVILLLIITVLSACVSTKRPNSEPIATPNLVCKMAAQYQNQSVGDGHCVSLIKQCSGAPQTKHWRPGARVLNSSLPRGTVIATFKNGRYPNRSGYHAAIYIEQDHQGIWVWDQWIGKPVHKRLIRIRYDEASPGNTAQAYNVVNTDELN